MDALKAEIERKRKERDQLKAAAGGSDGPRKFMKRGEMEQQREIEYYKSEARKEVQQLQRANMKNSQLKHDIERRLAQNQHENETLRKAMETRITGEERRERMDLE